METLPAAARKESRLHRQGEIVVLPCTTASGGVIQPGTRRAEYLHVADK
jgi:hypothetical protein